MRRLLIILTVMLCIAFVTELLLYNYELRRMAEVCANSSFPCDYMPQHPVGLFHSLSFVLLAAVLFAKKYYTALAIAAGYLVMHIFATYTRLETGFFGGNMCPEGNPCWAAIRRATWFDLTAFVILVVSIGSIGWQIFRMRNAKDVQDPE